MSYTVEQVLQAAAEHLGDPLREQYTDDVLLAFFSEPYSGLWDLLRRWGLPLPERTTYTVLPAYTPQIVPANAQIADMGEPLKLRERANITQYSITGFTNDAPRLVTVPGHPVGTCEKVTLSGIIPGSLNGEFWATKVDDNTISLNGTDAGEEYSSGGTVNTSPERFHTMESPEPFPDPIPQSYLRYWAWKGGVILVGPASRIIEVQITYRCTENGPTSGTVAIPGAKEYLANYTAALAAAAYGQPQQAQELTRHALGPSGEPDGTGGLLRSVVMPMLREKRNRVARPQPFRPRRSHPAGFTL